jgi:alkanesulfonate monooxygenase SsuD/methylene tetrahydromethanopterin reductase-like flavin-dependent oxidoreductase (luciferase family)
MEFWLFLPQMRLGIDQLVARARTAETAGFGGIAVMDHLAPPMAEDQPMYEALTTATWLAASTERLRVGQLVLCDAMRHPALLAKEAVTIDHASGGRFELGIGWGSVPAELERFGVADPAPGPRSRRLAETLAVLEALWSGEVVDHAGEFHHLAGAQQRPVPLSRIPIVIGGTGPSTMPLVARYAHWWNVPLTSLDRLDDLRGRAGTARVSVQLMVALVPDEDSRAEVTELATRRFGVYGDGLAIGSPTELEARCAALAERGVERIYTWFADFAAEPTLAAFGAEVIDTLGPVSASERGSK